MRICMLVSSLLILVLSLEAHPGHSLTAHESAFNSLHWLVHHPIISGVVIGILVYATRKRRSLYGFISKSLIAR